ncbi:Twin-arginine translocation pathway signal [Alteromonas sp. 38]|uniref:DUF1569 domain-containing protein n=1 Tax=Alteromonas TaxID=226 RepID=UPI0012F2C0B1|nr:MULTISPECIES: DUF1569 domain-containing protein [Alteromonas]CAD5263613.1 Twin-arginine translocation pathway signal [Alteromonas sp. 154]VXC19106.1 Twin-arginine translocation pathway signal [Alteromonas sp. 38]
MNRRNFLLGIIAGGAAIGATGIVWLDGKSSSKALSIDASIQTLDKVIKQDVLTLGDWDLYKILIHCAQSVEFSMLGYPEHKSDLFKNTVGKMAFSVFSARQEMTHGLSEAIPGAPSIEERGDINSAYTRFRAAMVKFRHYTGPLAEHFAYGNLNKQEYEKAHAMHFYNHLLEIETT